MIRQTVVEIILEFGLGGCGGSGGAWKSGCLRSQKPTVRILSLAKCYTEHEFTVNCSEDKREKRLNLKNNSGIRFLL